MNTLFRSIVFCAFCFPYVLVAQQFSIRGKVVDESNNPVIGATVSVPKLSQGVSTDKDGNYNLVLSEGRYEIVVSFVGLKTITRRIQLQQDTRIDYKMSIDTEQLDEVVITGDDDQRRIYEAQLSVNELTIESIKSIPVALGEADVVKSLLLLPGVTNAGESASGFNVRGGAADQNLVLLDDGVVFNPSHIFGFFSVFNSDAIRDVKLYKGAIPARYGGRLSSVLQVSQREGNNQQFEGRGGIGTVASRLVVEGPLQESKSSYLLGGRYSQSHLLLPLFDIENSAYFYDFNATFNFEVNPKNSIQVSGYLGQDAFNIENSFENDYGNAIASMRWNHLFSDRMSSNLSLTFSEYNSTLDLDLEGLKWKSGIRTVGLNYGIAQYLGSKFQINYGISSQYFRFNPGDVSPNSEDSGVAEETLTRKFANEMAVYIDAEHSITSNLNLEYGLRISHFFRFGQDEFPVYRNDDPIFFDPFLLVYTQNEPVEVIEPGRWGTLSQFNNLEPRFALAYAFNPYNSIKASYTRMAQYLHLISNTNSPAPLDVWAPSGPFIDPQILDQYGIGYFKNFRKGGWTIETEIFYKDIDNRLDYIDGADLIANNSIEQVILPGKARAYGWEFLLRKKSGRITGWIAYTLSKSEQRTPGRTPKVDNGRSNRETGINLGEWYNTPFDKRHDISLFASYELGEKWNVNMNFVYQTGQPTNFPIGQFDFQGLVTPYFGPRNSVRLPDYHRLDFSFVYQPTRGLFGGKDAEWVFGIYNVYNRLNAAAINFRRNLDTGANEAIRTSVFGIVPSVTYNFKF